MTPDEKAQMEQELAKEQIEPPRDYFDAVHWLPVDDIFRLYGKPVDGMKLTNGNVIYTYRFSYYRESCIVNFEISEGSLLVVDLTYRGSSCDFHRMARDVRTYAAAKKTKNNREPSEKRFN
jgi:hypothetical protein